MTIHFSPDHTSPAHTFFSPPTTSPSLAKDAKYCLEEPHSDTTLLCIEVGSSRIKAGALGNISSLDDLRKICTYAIPSAPFLSLDKLPFLFRQHEEHPMPALFEGPPHMGIALSVAGPVFEDGRYISPAGEPIDLAKICKLDLEEHSAFAMYNDAVSWAHGCLAYQTLKGERPTFPCLALTLGTGVGVALCLDENTIIDIEHFYILDDCPFSKLKELSKDQPSPYWSPSRALGKPYFDWIFHEAAFEDEEMTPYLDAYNLRLRTYIEELTEYIERTFKVTPASLMIGGGFSRFVTCSKDDPVQMSLFNPKSMETEGISADAIQLLGVHRAMQNHAVSLTVPSFESITARLEAYRDGRYPPS